MAKAGSSDGDKPPKARAKKAASKAPARSYERPRGGEARAIADMVPEIGRTAFRKFGFIQSSVVSRWREIVGDRLADVTQPAMIRFPAGQKAGGTLHLTISGAHAPMLQHVAPRYRRGGQSLLRLCRDRKRPHDAWSGHARPRPPFSSRQC